jgi:hypothetical protein
MDWTGFAVASGISALVLAIDAAIRRAADWLLQLPGDDSRTKLGYKLLAGIPTVLGLELVLVGLGYDLTICLYKETLAINNNLLASLSSTVTDFLVLGAAGVTAAVALVLFARIIIVERHDYYDVMEQRCRPRVDCRRLERVLNKSKARGERNAIASVGAIAVMLPSLMLFYHM